MKLSLVLTAYNKGHYLRFLLECVKRQLPDVELVLLDDGSSDETGAIMREYGDVFLRTEDIWETLANNAAMAAASGDYVAILQDDDLPLAFDWFRVMVEGMQATGIDVLSGRPFGCWHFSEGHSHVSIESQLVSINPREKIGIKVKRVMEKPGVLRLERQLHNAPFESRPVFEAGIYEAESVVRSPFIVSREVWDACGPFDAVYAPLMFDDYDFCFRARKAGYRIGYTNLPKRVRFGGGSHWLYPGGPRETFFAEVGERNEHTFLNRFAKEFPPFENLPLVRIGSLRFNLDRNLIDTIAENEETIMTIPNNDKDCGDSSAVDTASSIPAVRKLMQSSDLSEAVHLAAAEYLKNGPNVATARTIIVETVRAQRYDYFEEILVLVRAHESTFLSEGEIMMFAGFAAWAQRSFDECERWSKRLIALHPAVFNGYLRLGMNYLSMRQPMDAFLTFSAGLRNAKDSEGAIKTWWKLAEHLARGNEEAVFEKWGHRFRFKLSCFSTQSIEADAVHVSGRFTEEEELAYLGTALQGCRHLLEVGTLVGNHSVVFATMLKPNSLRIVDANTRSVEETRHNLLLNQGAYPETELIFKHAALAGPGTKTVEIEGHTVDAVTLDKLLAPEIDFVKIDVDGMEAQLLEPLCRLLPGRTIKMMIEVENHLRADFVDRLTGLDYRLEKSFGHGSYWNLFFVPAT